MLKDQLPKIITELPGPKSLAAINRRSDAIPHSIPCTAPCVIDRAEGAAILDLDGNVFLDFVGGIGVMNIGHSHPEVISAVKEQAERYFHPQINTIHYEEYIALAEKLNDITPGSHKKRTAFFNSGSEAVDNAVKIARSATSRPNVIAFTGAFHGRTYMAMTLTAAANPYQAEFAPLCPGVYRAPYPNAYHMTGNNDEQEASAIALKALGELLDETVMPSTVAAIIMEPVQGEAGFVRAPIGFVKGVREICDKHGILLIADEIQTGYCRTGRLFATSYWEDAGVYPDLITSAKSLAAGLPISAITGRDEIMQAPSLPGQLGGTYGGNPLACASALKVIEVMERDDFAGKAMRIGEKTVPHFEKWQGEFDAVGTWRCTGAMLSVEFVKNRSTKEADGALAGKIIGICKENGLILKNAGIYGQIIRMLMPLCITDGQLEAGLQIIEHAIEKSI